MSSNLETAANRLEFWREDGKVLKLLGAGSLLMPWRFRKIQKYIPLNQVSRVLDIGCGNRWCQLTKKWIQAEYWGLDRDFYNGESEDYSRMNRFFKIDLERDSLAAIPDSSVELITIAHVIEHIDNGLDVLQQLTSKLKPEGVIYIEWPSVRSLDFPSAEGTLQFCDDDTHKRLYSVVDVANALLKVGLKVRAGGTKRDWLVAGIYLPLLIPYQFYRKLRFGKFTTRYHMWDIFGFCEYVVAVKPS
jgi:SAM-dependent methyltransferase